MDICIGFFISSTTLELFSSSAFGSDVVLRAKSANVIRLHLQTRREVADFNLEVSLNGETYHNCSVGLPRAWQLFFSISQTARDATIVVPVVGGFSGGVERFLFREPGRKWFRWTVIYLDESEPSLIEQEVVVLESSDADIAFIEGLADPALCRLILGQRWYDEFMDPNLHRYTEIEPRAVKVIGRLLYATRGKTCEDAVRIAGPQGDRRDTANALLGLARDIPDSSYAPYAAYYAGCCYGATGYRKALNTVRKERADGKLSSRAAESRRRFTLMEKDDDCDTAIQALKIAAQRGDDYLKPKALHQIAFLRGLGGAFDEAEDLLRRAEQVVPGEGGVEQLANRLRKSLRKEEERVSTTGQPGEAE